MNEVRTEERRFVRRETPNRVVDSGVKGGIELEDSVSWRLEDRTYLEFCNQKTLSCGYMDLDELFEYSNCTPGKSYNLLILRRNVSPSLVLRVKDRGGDRLTETLLSYW